MCGIVGYIGSRDAEPFLIEGLKRLEYRGYDSAGIAILSDSIHINKCKGKVADLEQKLDKNHFEGTIGIGHTRWATHGKPDSINAHPHLSMDGKFCIIHNGIIENYESLKKDLQSHGVTFQSKTDTEVLVNLIEQVYKKQGCNAEQAVRIALSRVIGAYGIVVMCLDEPDKLIAARQGSPLVIGIGKGEYFIASDASPLVSYTSSVIYLNEQDVATITRKEVNVVNLVESDSVPEVQEIDLELGEITKDGYEHFMLKEIFEQSQTIRETFRGRVNSSEGMLRLGGLFHVLPTLVQAQRIIIIGCGTSWHAGLVGEYLFEDLTRIPVEVEYASEFRYRNPIITKDDIVIAISQSGETADTLAAIQMAKERGALVLGICNVVGSSIPRETDAGVYTHAGPEIGVASTKAFTSQVTVLALMAILIARQKGVIGDSYYRHLLKELDAVPEKIAHILDSNDLYKDIAMKFKESSNALYLGRGFLFPVALEGALKLKEISYIHAEGYPAAEMKHGPIALIDENMPVVVMAIKDSSYKKIVSNIQEIKARNAHVIAIVTEGDTVIKELADHVFEIPESEAAFIPLLAVVPLQLLSYYIAVLRGCDVDQPRNLAKSVTVE